MRLLIYAFFSILFSLSQLHAQIEEDSLALISIYNSTAGENWVYSWDFASPISEWHGVTIIDNRVVGLNLRANNLVGTIPDLHLTALKTLSLSINEISGIIPNFTYLAELQSLFLDLNSLSGNIPEFTNSPNLQILHCAGNALEGDLPSFQSCPNIENIRCGDNLLSGEIHHLALLEQLDFCSLSNNNFTGTIPEFGLGKLVVLHLNGNNFIGELPSFENTPRIKVFYCDNNQLTGEIPRYKDLTSFEIFHCYNNNLTGAIPEFENHPILTNIDCSGNQLSGELPALLSTPKLRSLICEDNSISGTVPDYAHLTKLQQLNFSNNQIGGTLPDIGSWPEFSSLLAENNQLEGTIPFEKPSNLLNLQLGNNNFEGCYPDYICDLWRFGSANNPLLPWLGDHLPFCAGEDQIGAPCDDNNPDTPEDHILETCICGDISSSTQESFDYESFIIIQIPRTNALEIKGMHYENFEVYLYDIAGKQIANYRNQNILQLPNLHTGAFVVRIFIKDLNMSISKKIIVD